MELQLHGIRKSLAIITHSANREIPRTVEPVSSSQKHHYLILTQNINSQENFKEGSPTVV
jgi:hypothetical protein